MPSLFQKKSIPNGYVKMVLGKKVSGKWRICVDYTDLNRACSNDSHPFSNTNQLVDNSVDYQLLSFMDAYSRYNQIPMFEHDRVKIAFMTEQVDYQYNVMSFMLKNVGATYQ